MSEEKPTFKVTDRRLFNADGSARDVPEKDEPEIVPAASENVIAAPATETGPAIAKTSTEPGPSAKQAVGGESELRSEEKAPGDQSSGGDPQAFLMLVEFVASFAADALGMVDRPGEGRAEINLPLARQCIDMLVTLKEKTRDNLSAEEQQVLEVILSQLRMQFVKASSAARGPQAPRNFTGGDITGGI